MLDLTANDPLIKTYLKDLQLLKTQSVTHELGLRGPFQTLLDKTAKKRGWTLVPELSTYSGGKRVVHPNREDDPAYIVHLVGQVVRVSFATVQIVKSLPNYRWRTKLL